jgi:capsular polysaccharide biosynthesis protein
MATSLAHQQEGEQFRVLDPPSLPASPSFPKKINFVGDGSGAGLILSLAILYILMTMDKTLHTEKDVEACLKVPVLVGIPMLEIPDSNNSRLSFPEQSVVASE